MSDSSTEPEPTRPASSPSGSSPADEQTIIGTPQPAQGGEGGLVRLNARPGLSVQDLADDPLLARAPKRRVEPLGVVAPALGGIPILARLGKGGMGAVYYGVHPRLDIEVAVKVLPTAPAQSNPDLVQRFLREAKVAAKVKSAHLVGVLDVNDEAGLYYIVMEYVRGESAGELLRRVKNSTGGGLSEFGALELLEAAAKGLAAAHRAGIIHRDIKPDNLMIPKREGGNELLYAEAKLADLGLARSELADVALTGNQAAMGTPGYMAPEQGKDARTAGKPADVFSMGAALFALLSGRAPFQGPTAIKILFATLAEPHPPIRTLRPDVSPATAALIDRCLQKDPAARYADAGELAAALAACKAGLSAAPRTPNAPSSAVATSVPGAAGPHTPPPLTPAPAHAPPGPPQVDRASNKAALIAGLLAGVLIFGGLGAWGLVVLGRDLNSTADPLPQPQPLPQPLEPVPSPPYVDPGPTPPPPPSRRR
ncbi:MAG: serine/threonine protein kinase [Planctomycetota bacterium]|nr:serine/threonine protein kinase [Planctomycetota bacterium]